VFNLAERIKKIAIFFVFCSNITTNGKKQFPISSSISIKRRKKMSKGTGARKEEKKKPTKTLKEKRADKKAKKKA